MSRVLVLGGYGNFGARICDALADQGGIEIIDIHTHLDVQLFWDPTLSPSPLHGVNTIPVFTDASFLHAHLHVARRVYGRLGAANFAPVDLSGLLNGGLAVGAVDCRVS